MISIPVDTVLQAQAAEVLGRSGITVELAVRMLFAHVATHGSLPAGLGMPNADTREAMADADAIIAARRVRGAP